MSHLFYEPALLFLTIYENQRFNSSSLNRPAYWSCLIENISDYRSCHLCEGTGRAAEGRVTVWIAKMRSGERPVSVPWLRDTKTRIADSEIKCDNIFNLIEIRNHFVFKLPIYLSKFESRLGSEIKSYLESVKTQTPSFCPPSQGDSGEGDRPPNYNHHWMAKGFTVFAQKKIFLIIINLPA